MKNYENILSLAAALVLLTACATTPGADDSSVEQRSAARWQTLIDGDLAGAYAFYSPGYRSAVSYDTFEAQMKARTIVWKEARLGGVDCETDVCIVRSTVTYATDRPMRGVSRVESATSVEERWIRVENAWYFVPDRLR